VSWVRIPEILVRGRAFPVAWAGTLESVLDLTSTPGEVTIERERRSLVEYSVRIRPC
jgi:hypothetical protein